MIETSTVEVAAFQEARSESPVWRSITGGGPSGDNTNNDGSEDTWGSTTSTLEATQKRNTDHYKSLL